MTSDPSPNELRITEIQEEVLAYWERIGAFEKSLSVRSGDKEAVFYDGPPFPTGQPHHGTVLVSFIKDMLARYLTMQGYCVPRVWGWDCHGLPIEVQVEKHLNLRDKCEIEERVGVAAFNQACRELVSKSNDSWRTYVREMARWVDYDHGYKTHGHPVHGECHKRLPEML